MTSHGAESSGPFWNVYPLRETGKALRYSVVVRVAPSVLRKARIPAEYTSRAERARFAKGAAFAERELYEKEQREHAERAKRVANGNGLTFHAFAKLWTSGELRKLYPAHVKAKKSVSDDAQMLAVLKPSIGDVPLREFRVEDGERALAALPKHYAAATVKKYGLFVHRVLALAVYPGKLIASNPLPRGFLPAKTPAKAKTFLYPSEDAQLMACRDVPLARRVLYGVLAREGMRLGEALALRWADVDLERGTISLDTNKTNDPRTWVTGDDVRRALKAWRNLNPKMATVFRVETRDGEPLHHDSLATAFREWDLPKAKVDRPALFARTADRIPIRVHDLRASFVTLALAAGRSESWVTDRTGHRSSQMLALYKRSARTAAELGLGWFAPLDGLIPELASADAPAGNVSGGNADATATGAVSASVSRSADASESPSESALMACENINDSGLVPKEGVEPSRGVTSADFESAASADSATSAYVKVRKRKS